MIPKNSPDNFFLISDLFSDIRITLPFSISAKAGNWLFLFSSCRSSQLKSIAIEISEVDASIWSRTDLSKIKSPADIRNFSREQLQQLVDELRQYTIETISQIGGHLAPTLGVVELTVALHKVFKTPSDKIVWDVGHQGYAHKILTGRFD